ncbi:MAG: ABC transporter permease [Acidobacteriota bacterium]
MRRDLIHYWRTNIPVTLGAAVATAVLAGALIVGDSVRGSLEQLTLERLGGFDQALAGQRFFPEAAATRFADAAAPLGSAPAILLQGSAQHGDTKARASGVGLTGADSRFFSLFGAEGEVFGEPAGIFPPVVLNSGLADALGAAVGDTVLFSLKRWTEVPSGSLLSKDDTASTVETVRLEVQSILPDSGLGSFGLAVHQSTPFNAFVPLADLQRALDQEGSVNAILTGEAGGESQTREEAYARSAELDDLLRQTLDLEELGLRVVAIPRPEERDPSTAPQGIDQDDEPPQDQGGYLHVESGEYVLRPPLVAALAAEAAEQGARQFRALTYLANAMRAGERSVPYSTVTALNNGASESRSFGELTLADGSGPAPTLTAGQILINAWTAERLEVAAGDAVTLEFFTIGPREELIESSQEFTVAGVVGLEGLGADSTLSQEYPGIAGTADMSEWDPPFPIELDLVGAEDEAYWDDFRDTPKAFVSLEEGQELWRTRWGQTTAFRVEVPEGEDVETFRASFSGAVQDKVSTATFGLTFQPVKALGLGASGGATDFGGLFIGLSQFVIASAALLVALLFGLAIEQRVREIGLRLAVGFKPKAVRRLLISQGLALAALGGILGLAGAVGYARMMMYGLKTWWLPAVGTSRLELFLTPASLAGGFIGALLVVFFTIFMTVRRVGRTPTPLLLKGSTPSASDSGRAGRLSLILASTCLLIAVGAIAFAVLSGISAQAGLFFLAGPMLLIGLLALFARLIDRDGASSLAQGGARALAGMAIANTRRHRRRSLYSTTLVAFATFMIVTVAAFEEGFSEEDLGLESGAGGYQLIAEADVPLPQDLGSREGRFELGLGEEAESLLQEASVIPMRLVPGDDTSCLNLYQPGQPRLLGIPKSQRERGGFTFQNVLEDVREGASESAWHLLDLDLGEGVVPVIGDINSTQWILKLKLGEDIEMENERGEPLRLRLVANLKTTVFQSELLISEENLLRHFPNRSGFPYFLIETERPDEVSGVLERELSAYGLDATSTADKLASFHAVQNTYLATFRVLGGLGLLLGTLGLAVVLVRNVLERQGELAALRAFGFRRRTLFGLILGENLTLLIAGLLVGTVAALATAAPHVLHQASAIPWASIFGTLGLVFLVGVSVCFLAARGSLRADLIPALKAER